MDFRIDSELQESLDQLAEFAREKLQDDVSRRDRVGEFPSDLWKLCADFGIQSLASTLAYGGNADTIKLMPSLMAMETLGKHCSDGGLLLALNAQMWTVQLPILDFGTEEQKQRFLPGMCRGEIIGSHALTEPEAGSDVYSMKMTAEKVEGGYRLNGTKRFITLGSICDFALVFASTNPAHGKWGITAFLVPSETQGFTRGEVQQKMGLRTVPFCELQLKDCFVPEELRLGKEGAGFAIGSHSLEYDRCCMLAGKLGAMERQLEQTIDYVKSRKQFGQKISSFQAVSHRIAEMKTRIEAARLLLYRTAWKKDQGEKAILDTAMVKLMISESYVQNSLDAIRSHGGNGYLEEYGVEKDLRDAVGSILYAGTSDIQKNIIAKMLGL